MMSSFRRAFIFTCWVCCTIGLPAASAAGVAGAAAAPEARQFDFLIGQWQVSGEVKTSGLVALIHGRPKLVGSWKAWRVVDGHGIEDELTLTDASGNPASAVHFTRTFSREESCWKITARDTNTGGLRPATARWQGDEMLVMGSGTSPEGKHFRSRTHYVAITPVSFRMVQDRSYDEGKTWEAAAVTLDVHRNGS
jgi:hypothetical protein